MYLYNSATHKKEELKTHTPNHVEMYTCGPTVYHFAHIGNLRSYIMEDVLEKYLRFAGYSVNRVMNITDVGHLTSDADEGEDKMLKGAKREHKSVMEIAQFYTDAFFADCQKLHIKRPDVVQPATGLIDAACARFHIDRTKSCFVGDSDSDMLCAQNAGLKGLRYEGGSLLNLVTDAI